MLVRAANLGDLEALLALAHSAGAGLTTLPASEERLRERLQLIEQSFAGQVPQADADYLLVLEGVDGSLIGSSCMLEERRKRKKGRIGEEIKNVIRRKRLVI